MDLMLNGKRALVTGGSKGIGRAIARQLALEGVDVVIAARNQAELDAAAAELAQETGRKIVGLTVDTQDDASVNTVVAGTVAALTQWAEAHIGEVEEAQRRYDRGEVAA